MSPRFIGYPAGWTLAVMEGADAAQSAAKELRAAGVPPEDVVVLTATDTAAQIKRLGSSTGVAARIRRGVQFLTMDQMPDLHVYELAIGQGHPVIAIRVPDAEERRRAIATVQRHGGHFVNRFGDWATEEIAPWRGRMPDLPQHLQR